MSVIYLGSEGLTLAPTFSSLQTPLEFEYKHGGYSYKMAAALTYLQSHWEDPCVMVAIAAKATFLAIRTAYRISHLGLPTF